MKTALRRISLFCGVFLHKNSSLSLKELRRYDALKTDKRYGRYNDYFTFRLKTQTLALYILYYSLSQCAGNIFYIRQQVRMMNPRPWRCLWSSASGFRLSRRQMDRTLSLRIINKKTERWLAFSLKVFAKMFRWKEKTENIEGRKSVFFFKCSSRAVSLTDEHHRQLQQGRDL